MINITSNIAKMIAIIGVRLMITAVGVRIIVMLPFVSTCNESMGSVYVYSICII